MKKEQLRNIVSLLDDDGVEYFSCNVKRLPKGVSWHGKLRGRGPNICSFLFQTMPVTRKVTGLFSSDLTSRDDVILAILSLILLLVIESIISTILLRTSQGKATNEVSPLSIVLSLRANSSSVTCSKGEVEYKRSGELI